MPLSNKPRARTLRLPAKDIDQTAVTGQSLSERNWFRVHQARHSPIFFSINSNHRFSHPECPHPVLYLGADLDTCQFERFGDELYDHGMTLPESLWRSHDASLLSCPALFVCDLTQPQTISAMRVDYTALMSDNLEIPQAWGLAIQRHPANFEGIKYNSRFNGKPCLAIFDRNGIADKIETIARLGSLVENDAAADWLWEHKAGLY